MRLRGAHFATGERHDWIVADGHIQAVESPTGAHADAEAAFVAPAFFDLQINGGAGIAFGKPHIALEEIRQVVHLCRQHGIGGFCPTLITNSFQALENSFTNLRRAREADASLARAMPLFHLEGPYIAADDGPRGAHPRAHVRRPDWDEFQRLQEAAGGNIRILTLAPEHEGSLHFIERLVKSGVVVALGHTTADAERIRDAVTAGARLSTHLGNGCDTMLHRHDNPIWEQLAADELWASIICDGHHLPPALVRCILRMKTPSRIILTCDASSLAGVPPGRYREWEQELEVRPEGRIVVCGQNVLAGSWAFTDRCVANAIRVGGLSLAEAIASATYRPRDLLGLPVQTLDVGQPADLVLFNLGNDGAMKIQRTIICGEDVLPAE
jgi:N-acetylglucosamine-6-phosphate deacetylase